MQNNSVVERRQHTMGQNRNRVSNRAAERTLGLDSLTLICPFQFRQFRELSLGMSACNPEKRKLLKESDFCGQF